MAFTPELLYGGPLLKEELERVKKPRPAMENTQAVQAEVAKIARKNTPSAELRQDMQRKKEERADSKVAVEPLKIQKDAKAKAEERLKAHEDADFDWTDAAARQKHEQERAHLQAAVDQAGKALAKAESEQAVKSAQDSLGALSPEEDAALGAYIMERDSHNANTMNPMVDNPFGPLYSQQTRALLDKYGKTAVDAMAEERRRTDSAKITESVAKTAREQANSGGLGAAAASLATVPAQILGGAVGVFDTINSMANGTGARDNLDPNSLGNLGNVYSQNVRGMVAKNLEGDGGFGGKAASIAYQAAMSLADNVARAFFGGAGGATLAATQGFAQTMAAASEQGATPAQAALLATASTGIEFLTEKIPLDDLISVAKGNNAGAIIRNLLRSAGIEAGTEELSLLGTVLAEAAILRENSAYQQEIQGMIDGGMSPEEAKEEANRGFIDEAINTMIVSGLAGGVGGLGASLRGRQVQADADYQAMQQAQEAETESPAQSAGQEEVSTQEAVQSPAEAVPGPVEAMTAAVVQNRPQMEQVQQNPSEDLVNRAVAGMFGGAESESTAINTDPARHTPEEQATINDYQNSVDENLVEYVEAVRNNPGKKMPKYPLKNVGNRAAQDIKRITGVDVSGNKTMLEPRIVEHILKRHGKDGNADNSMRDVNDIGRIQYVIDNYDTMEDGGRVRAYVTPGKNGKDVPAQSVVIKKKVNGTYFVVEAVPDTKRKTIYITSAYMSKDGKAETAPSLSVDAGAPRVTPDSVAKSDAVSNNSIPESVAQVNGNYNFEHLGRANAAIAELRQSDEYKAMSRDQRVQAEDSGQPIPEGMKGTGAAEQNFSGKAAYADLLREGNVQRDRPGDVRPVEVPKKDGSGRRVTEFAGNAYGAAATPDYMANEIESLIQDGKMGFDTRSNQESLQRAAEALENNTDGVKAQITENLAKNMVQDGDVEKAMLLYVKNANSKAKADQEAAAQLLVQLGQMANISGRNLQLFSMLRRMTPEGKLMYAQKAIDKEIARLNKGRSRKKQIAEPEIPPTLQEDYLNAKTEEETQAALDAIYMDAAAKIKPTLGEMWDAWRNMAMLMNPKTHIRNIGATGAFQPFVQVKRAIGAGLEKTLLGKNQRTKSVLGADSRSRDLMAWAKADAKNPRIIERMGQTYATGNEAQSKIQEYRKILPGGLDKMRKANMDIMEREDRFFKKGEYARSLASFLKARGYTAQDLKVGTVPGGILEEGRTLAIKEAQKATFNDRNAFSDTVAKLGRGVDKIPVIGKIVSKGALPFLRTPANVVARAWDYSPMKLAQTFYQVHQNSIDAATAIDQVSGALTGSAAMALGVALAAGIVPNVELVGKLEDEDEKENEALAYSLRIGGKYYGVSWLSPTMIPLFIGANLYDKFQALGEENGMDGWDVAQAFMEFGAGVVSPMLELSMLSSLNDAIATFAEEDDPGMGVLAALLNSATSYFTQGLPTIFGQAEQATETEKSSTYVNTDNKVERVIKKALGSASQRIPTIDLFQTPRLDEFGQVVKNEGNGWVRGFNAFLNPFNVSQRKTDPISQELSRLRKAGAENASIPLPQRTISYTDTDGEKHTDVRLSQEQFQKLAEKQGQTEQTVLSALLDSDDFRAMSDEVKDDVLELVHSYAKETGELAAIENHLGYSATWMEELAEAEDPAKYIVQRVSGTNLNRAMTDLDTAWGHGWNTKAKERALDEAYEEYKSMSKEAQKEIEAFTTGTAKKYLEARGKGISHEDFLAAAKNVETVQGTGKYNSETKENKVRDIDKREAIAKTTGLSYPQIDIIMKAYMPDYDPTDEKPNKTELKYDYARKELGYSPAEYADIYRAYLEHDKKVDKIKEIMKLGYDYGTANQMYKLFQGRVDVVAWAGK